MKEWPNSYEIHQLVERARLVVSCPVLYCPAAADLNIDNNVVLGKQLEKERNHDGAMQAEHMYQKMIATHVEEPQRWFGRAHTKWYD